MPSIVSRTTNTTVSLGVLDVLLCALVDRSRNIRTFEEVGGLKEVVTILKDKNVVKSVRYALSLFQYSQNSNFHEFVESK